MKAVRLNRLGEDLVINELDIPKPKGREVLIKVKAAGVCHSDVHYKHGGWGNYSLSDLGYSLPKLPLTMGHEIAGVVDSIGETVTGLDVGSKVAVNPWEGEGLCYYCSIGEEQMCDRPQRLGINRDGGYAEYVLVPDFRYTKVIKTLSFEEAAPLTCAGVTTYRAIRVSMLEPGQTLVIIGSGGGLGTLAIKLAKNMSITNIIGVDVRDDAIKASKDAGANNAINALTEDPKREIFSLTNGKGADAIIDLNNSEITLKTYSDLLSKLGKYIMVGQFGSMLNYNAVNIVRKGIEFRGIYTGNQKDFVNVIELAENKHIKPSISIVGNLNNVNEAIHNLEQMKVSGRQIINP